VRGDPVSYNGCSTPACEGGGRFFLGRELIRFCLAQSFLDMSDLPVVNGQILHRHART